MSQPSSSAVSRIRSADHHPEVEHLVVVAAEDDADDVLADVVDVALDGGEHHLAAPRPFASAFSASMNGSRYATARFIARALFTTCGRNIRPDPNRSPTTDIPSISGPSITSSGRSSFCRASSVSSSMKSTIPWTSA